MEATTLGLKTKSGLRPYSRYKASLYTVEAATYWAINRTRQTRVQPRIRATGSRDRVMRVKKVNVKESKVLKVVRRRGSQSEVFGK